MRYGFNIVIHNVSQSIPQSKDTLLANVPSVELVKHKTIVLHGRAKERGEFWR